MKKFPNHPSLSAKYSLCIPFHISELLRQSSALSIPHQMDTRLNYMTMSGKRSMGFLGERSIQIRSSYAISIITTWSCCFFKDIASDHFYDPYFPFLVFFSNPLLSFSALSPSPLPCFVDMLWNTTRKTSFIVISFHHNKPLQNLPFQPHLEGLGEKQRATPFWKGEALESGCRAYNSGSVTSAPMSFVPSL